MFQLDDKFLQDLGLDQLPEEEKQAFLQHIYSELELRVGTKLSDGLNDDQLAEFEKIIDKDQVTIEGWIVAHTPNFETDEAYQRLKAAAQPATSELDVRSEYVATKWLEVNRPDYRQVVAQTLEELKKEIIGSREAILSSDDQSAAA